MEFDSNSDQDFLHELFGQDTLSLFEYVYLSICVCGVSDLSAIQGGSLGICPRT